MESARAPRGLYAECAASRPLSPHSLQSTRGLEAALLPTAQSVRYERARWPRGHRYSQTVRADGGLEATLQSAQSTHTEPHTAVCQQRRSRHWRTEGAGGCTRGVGGRYLGPGCHPHPVVLRAASRPHICHFSHFRCQTLIACRILLAFRCVCADRRNVPRRHTLASLRPLWA